MMARTMILPAALRYQARSGRRRSTPTKAAGVDNSAQAELLKIADGDDHRVPEGDRRRWTRRSATTPTATPFAHAKYCRDTILPAMTAVRTLGDKLETMVADDLWPLPTYREMLFIK